MRCTPARDHGQAEADSDEEKTRICKVPDGEFDFLAIRSADVLSNDW